MNRKDDGGSHVDDLMGLVIGLVGVLCVWVAGMVGGGAVGAGLGGLGGWVSDPDGELRWFDGGGWFDQDSDVFDAYRKEPLRGDEFPGKRVVLLIHGLDEPGGIWDEVAPELDDWGYQVVRFDYPNDQAVVASATGLTEALDRLGRDGVEYVDIVAHSMGGLVSREALTNPSMGGSTGEISGVEINRLILVGTPNEGSVWARMRGVAEVREHVLRWMASDDMDLSILGNLGEDGDGQAGIDLLPGSDFLVALNARPMPGSVVVTCIVGRVVDPALTAGMSSADEAADVLGDGVVSVESASLDGCEDVVLFVANHRSLIRTIEFEEGWRAMMGFERADQPGGIWIILDRLGWGKEAGPNKK